MKKLSYLLSIFVIPCSFALNLNHSLNNYGFLDASLPAGIKAQTSSTGGGGSTSTDPFKNCRTLQVSHDWTTIVCSDPKTLGRVVVSSSTIVVKCSNTLAGMEKTCQSGTEKTKYYYPSDIDNGCFSPEVSVEGVIRSITCQAPSN